MPEFFYRPFMKKVLKLLRIHTVSGALAISDTALRMAYLDGGKWQLKAIRLPPDVVKGGVVHNAAVFKSALAALRTQAALKRGKAVHVMLCLESSTVYAQVFRLPPLVGQELEKAIDLNMQMISPSESQENYSGWQIVDRRPDASTIDVFGCFIERSIVDPVTSALFENGFLAVAAESRSLAVARVLRLWSSQFRPTSSYIVAMVDEVGIDLMVLRHGYLYFDYITPWRDIYASDKTVTPQVFDDALVRNINQVLNFHRQHWQEPLQDIFVSAGALQAEAEKVIAAQFSLTVRQIALRGNTALPAYWYPALGSALRAVQSGRPDEEINLLGPQAVQEFSRQQAAGFFAFWRVLIPATLIILVATFFGIDAVLITMRANLKGHSAVSAQFAQELHTLDEKAQLFNKAVASLRTLQSTVQVKSVVFPVVKSIVDAHAVSINRITVLNFNSPVTMSAEAKTVDDIVAFKQALETNAQFSNVQLPLGNVRPGPQSVSFSVSFTISSSTSPKTP